MWVLLEIEPTTDLKTVKRAYAKKLRLLDENDITGLDALENAFLAAREYCQRDGSVIVLDENNKTSNLQEDESHSSNPIAIDFCKLLFTNDTSQFHEILGEIASLPLDEENECIKALQNFVYYNEMDISIHIHKLTLALFRDRLSDDEIVFVYEKQLYLMFTSSFVGFDVESSDMIYHQMRKRYYYYILNKKFISASRQVDKMKQNHFQKWSKEIQLFEIMVSILYVDNAELDMLYARVQELLSEYPKNGTLILCSAYLCARIYEEDVRIGYSVDQKASLLELANAIRDIEHTKFPYHIHNYYYRYIKDHYDNKIAALSLAEKDKKELLQRIMFKLVFWVLFTLFFVWIW